MRYGGRFQGGGRVPWLLAKGRGGPPPHHSGAIDEASPSWLCSFKNVQLANHSTEGETLGERESEVPLSSLAIMPKTDICGIYRPSTECVQQHCVMAALSYTAIAVSKKRGNPADPHPPHPVECLPYPYLSRCVTSVLAGKMACCCPTSPLSPRPKQVCTATPLSTTLACLAFFEATVNLQALNSSRQVSTRHSACCYQVTAATRSIAPFGNDATTACCGGASSCSLWWRGRLIQCGFWVLKIFFCFLCLLCAGNYSVSQIGGKHKV